MKGLGKRIALFPLPYVGHLNPMFELANILYARGFSISIIHTNFNSPDPTKHPNFTFHPIADGLSAEETVSGHDVIALATKLNTTCIEPLRECLAGLMSESSGTVTCVIVDAMWHFSQSVADSLQLPRIVLRTGNLASFAAFVAFPVFREKGYFSIQDTQPEELVPELPPLRIKDIPRIKVCDPQQLSELLSNLVIQAKASRGLIFNTFDELEHHMVEIVRRDFPQTPVFPIGPFHKYIPSSPTISPDSSITTWLNAQSPKSVLYVSFGSLAAIDQAQFSELAWGLADSDLPFLWVVRSDLVRGTNGKSSAFPDGFLEKVGEKACIVDWAPQKEVLAHPAVGGFWTHSGWNSTLESVCEGVPMICLPCFGDQMVNARCVTDDWKIGLRIETTELSRGNVKNVVRRLMVEAEGEEMRNKTSKCLQDAANTALLPQGSSSKALENLINLILSF